ncbi:MAG TPA: tetratricopeptide repeat protein [Terriglobales bacterium]|nr:tetratricopeptide repeat protein [Terriglobales bacterium]
MPVIASEADKNQNPDRLFQAAVAQYDAGHFPEAARQLEFLARQLPESFEVQELLGLVYASESDESKANEHLAKAVQLKPSSAEARTNLATNLVHLGKLMPAESEFKKAVELDPASYDTNHNLGEFYVAAGKLTDAATYLQKAQQMSPTAYDNGYDLALAYLETGRTNDSRSVARDLLKQKNTAELHNLLGQIEEKDGNFVPAEMEYQTAAHMDPSESNLFDWGSELLVHRTLDAAIDVFQSATAHYPKSARLAIGLGMSLYSRGNYDDAVKALLKAADLSPTDSRCYYFLSKAYDSSPGQAEEVIRRFRRFVELQPQDAHAPYYYAMSLWKGRRAEDANLDLSQIRSLLEKSIALDPSLAEAHLQLGNLYADQQKYADAIPQYKLALRENDELADAHYRLGQAYVHSGQKDLAQEQLQKYQRLRAAQMAELDKQRAEIRQFVISEKETGKQQ